MFNKIKNILWIKTKANGELDSVSWGYEFFWQGLKKTKLSNSQLMELYTGYSFVCVNATAEGISGLDRKLLWSENRIDREKQHKYSGLITNSFLEEVVWFLEITGTVYIRKEVFGKSIDSLEVLRTDLVTPFKINGKVSSYDYHVNGTIKTYPAGEIFVIKSFSPFKNGEGISPLSALWKQQSMDEAIIEWNWNFFKNNASAGTTLHTNQDVSDEKKRSLVARWKAEFMWANNAHKVAILDKWLTQSENKPWQKDMDFVNQRMMIRDEIFTIFRVPKVVVWITDGVWFTDRKVWFENFSRVKLKPIALKIQQAFNENIFKEIWHFSFVNIIPVDTEQLAEDYRLWVITMNEYRTTRNYLPVKNGDSTITWDVLDYEELKKWKKEIIANPVELNIKNIFDTVIQKTSDVQKKRWDKKILRTDKYEKEFNLIMNNIFTLQLKDILKKVTDSGKKSIEGLKEETLLDETAYLIIYQSQFKSFFKRTIAKEGKLAIEEVGKYGFSDKNVNAWTGKNIKKFALSIDKNTKKEIIKIVKQGIVDGSGTVEINKNITTKFSQYSRSRVNKISRTEITRAVNYSRTEAWEQTGAVGHKEWWTALDERVSAECAELHGKKISLWDTFYDLWDTDSQGKKVDYEDIAWPPMHTNCRCDLIPILK